MGFVTDWIETEPILYYMGRGEHSGITIDLAKRDLLRLDYQAERKRLQEEIEAIVPEGCKPILKRKTLSEEVTCPRCAGRGSNPDLKKLKKKFKVKLANIQEFFKSHGRKPSYYLREQCPKCEGHKTVNQQVKPIKGLVVDGWDGWVPTKTDWRAVGEFNPSSHQHVKDYCHYMENFWKGEGKKGKAKAYQVPKYRGKETTDKTAMERLRNKTKDPIFNLFLAEGKFSTMLSRYMPLFESEITDTKKQKFLIQPNGRMYSTFTAMPSTWRMGSEDPNIQNIPKRPDDFFTDEMLHEYRMMFTAREGWELGQQDWKSAEGVTTGFYAQDLDFIEIAKRGLHAFLASRVLEEWGEPFESLDVHKHSDEHIASVVKEIKGNFPIVYDMCKRISFLALYGGTAFKIWMDNPGKFESMKQVQEILALLFESYGRKIRQWQHDTIELANEQHYLDNVFGYRHHFWDVYKWNPRKQVREWSNDAKRILAFLPQSTVTGVLRKCLRLLWNKHHWVMKYLRWPIHDSLITEYPKKLRMKVLKCVGKVMNLPITEMKGMRLGVETEVGLNWGILKEITI